MDQEIATKEIYDLVKKYYEKFGSDTFSLYYCPNDPAYVAKRLRTAIETGVPYDPLKEMLDNAPAWFREKYNEGKVLF